MARKTMMMLLVAILDINAQFQEQPNQGTRFVSVEDRITLRCSVETGYLVDWQVRFSDGSPIEAARRINRAIFAQRNFTFTGVATRSSTVSFDALKETPDDRTNNMTTIICVAQLGISAREPGNVVQVIFFGAPPSPTGLSYTEDELSFLISWSLGFIEGVPVNYTLTVLNLNTTSAQPIIIAGLLDQHYVFETSRPCDVYSFTVTAVTASGNSTPSQELIFARNDICSSTTIPRMTSAITLDDNQGESDDDDNSSTIASIIAPIAILVILVVGSIAIVIIVKWATAKGRGIKPVEVNVVENVPTKHTNIDSYVDLVTADAECLKTTIKCGQEIKVPLTIKCTLAPAEIDIHGILELSRNSSIIDKSKVKESPQGNYIVVTPQDQGKHMLGITVNGQHIKGSPFHFEVAMPSEVEMSSETEMSVEIEVPVKSEMPVEIEVPVEIEIPVAIEMPSEVERPSEIIEFSLNSPRGLTALQEEVLVVEEGRQGISVFRDHHLTQFISVGIEGLTEITVQEETGSIFVTTGWSGKVLKLNSDGKLINSAGSLKLANGLCIGKKNELYVCDTEACKLEVFDPDLRYIKTITGGENGGRPFQAPRDVDVGEDNTIYVAEMTGIQVLSPNREFIRIIGKGKLYGASALKIVEESIFVASQDGASLYYTDGTHVRDFYKGGVKETPQGITVDCDGYVYVSYTTRGKVKIASCEPAY